MKPKCKHFRHRLGEENTSRMERRLTRQRGVPPAPAYENPLNQWITAERGHFAAPVPPGADVGD